MDHVYFQHKNDRHRVLACDQDYCPISEEDIAQKELRNRALYVRFPQGFIGVYSSPAGPVLFVNNSKHVFSDWSWNVSVQKGDGFNTFSLIGLTADPLVFDYPEVELCPMDPWSEEVFDNFFLWLANKRHDREFMDMWTE